MDILYLASALRESHGASGPRPPLDRSTCAVDAGTHIARCTRVDVIAEILAARDCGVVHCGLSSRPSPSLSELAGEFGLSTDPATYREIDAASARRLVTLVLNQDMAYNTEVIAATRAAELAGQFLALFGTSGAQFFTNGRFHEARGPKLTWSGASWNPATAATFDTGVLIIGHECSGCLWVEDED